MFQVRCWAPHGRSSQNLSHHPYRCIARLAYAIRFAKAFQCSWFQQGEASSIFLLIRSNTFRSIKRVFAKIRYTWPLFGQNQLYSKNKYKTHPRSPAIGQADIVTDVGSKSPRCTWFCLLCLSFNWFWPTLNQSQRPFTCTVFSLRMRLPSHGWN